VGDYTGAHIVIFRGIFSIYYSPDGTCEAAMGGAGVGGRGGVHYIFEGLKSLDGWDGRGEGRGI
jgi:hypothetical protein